MPGKKKNVGEELASLIPDLPESEEWVAARPLTASVAERMRATLAALRLHERTKGSPGHALAAWLTATAPRSAASVKKTTASIATLVPKVPGGGMPKEEVARWLLVIWGATEPTDEDLGVLAKFWPARFGAGGLHGAADAADEAEDDGAEAANAPGGAAVAVGGAAGPTTPERKFLEFMLASFRASGGLGGAFGPTGTAKAASGAVAAAGRRVFKLSESFASVSLG
jgi:hypothetical protein